MEKQAFATLMKLVDAAERLLDRGWFWRSPAGEIQRCGRGAQPQRPLDLSHCRLTLPNMTDEDAAALAAWLPNIVASRFLNSLRISGPLTDAGAQGLLQTIAAIPTIADVQYDRRWGLGPVGQANKHPSRHNTSHI
jgi:hypothetical protein